MGKTILYIAISLDGYIAGPNEDLSWLNTDDENKDSISTNAENDNPYEWKAFFASVGAIIIGRNTYDLEMRNGWAELHAVPKFILTSKPKDAKAKEDDFFTHEDIEDVLKQAKQITNKNIWVEGGARVAQQFIERDLLDEMILFMAPVLLGGGIQLFGGLNAYKNYNLRNIRRYGGRMAQLEYTRKVYK